MTTKIAVILASYGRPEFLSELVRRLAAQSRPPDEVCVSVTAPTDAPADTNGAAVVISALGLCAQRNAGLDYIGAKADLITFFDDDFVPAPDYLERLEAYAARHENIGGVTGKVLRDGILGPGLTIEQADAAISGHIAPSIETAKRARRRNLYGCNMTFRREAIGGERFDETLPLYGWLEDVDFSVRVSKRGPMIWTNAIAGVHLGVKGGRVSGVRLGYSQIANPLYLHRKGTLGFMGAAENICSNFAANHIKLLRPRPYIDRAGRLKGNWLAIRDAMTGKINPQNVLRI